MNAGGFDGWAIGSSISGPLQQLAEVSSTTKVRSSRRGNERTRLMILGDGKNTNLMRRFDDGQKSMEWDENGHQVAGVFSLGIQFQSPNTNKTSDPATCFCICGRDIVNAADI